MRKLFFTGLLASVVIFVGCEKDTVDIPTADFAIYQLDSAKVATFSAAKIDTISNLFVSEYFIPLPEAQSTRVYKGRVVVKYTGTASKARVIYTGDASHFYVSNPNSPQYNASGSQSGVNFIGDIFSYTYPAGLYTITVISTNEGNKGEDVIKSVASKPIIVR